MRSFAERRRAVAALVVAVALLAGLGAGLVAQSTPAAALFDDARTMEQALRKELGAHRAGTSGTSIVRRARTLVATYEDIARLFPGSGYGDRSLWQGAMLAADVFDLLKDPADRQIAVRLAEALQTRYRSSPLVAQAERRLRSLPPALDGATPLLASDDAAAAAPPTQAPAKPVPAATAPATITVLQDIRREVLPDALRVTLELDREVTFYDERIDGPPRVFVDLRNTRAAAGVQDVRLAFDDDVVRQIRVGRQLDRRTRVVLDLNDAPRHSIYTLYKPFRIVIDFERRRSTPEPAGTSSSAAVPAAAPVAPASAGLLDVVPAASPAAVPESASVAATVPSVTAADRPISVPRSLATRPGGLSMSRQLGLGIARIVIDPGHGGHDPGASENGLTESELVLDVALRLEQLLQKADVEVVLTRRTNVYVPLEDRPAMATREQADLYLSIHANASADRRARGIETYILNFSASGQGEAVAARENRGSTRTMKSLADIVRAIALNNKIDESRALARQVQASLVERLSKGNRTVRNLGVKEAPFAVLLGADMPSILAEIAFITNRQDAALVKTAVYRQQVAEALADGIMNYQRRLKPTQVTATTR